MRSRERVFPGGVRGMRSLVGEWSPVVARARWAGLSLLGVLAVVPLAAQTPERGAFVLLRGQDTLAVERFERSPDLLQGTLVVRIQDVRLGYRCELTPDASVRALTVRAWRASMPDTAAPLQESGAVFRGDSVTFQATGQASRTMAAPGALPYLNLSGAFLEQFYRRAQATHRTEVPLLLQNATLGTMSVTPVGTDSAVLAIGGVEIRVAVDAQGRLLGATVPSQGIRFVRVADVAMGPTPKPDYSAPAGAPYTAEEVEVAGPAGKLVGTLTLPRARRGRIAAVVMITGSGPQDRDEALPTVPGYRPFRQIADTLSRRGIAVLRLDDRGTGGSAAGPADPTSEDFARDIEAAVAYLRGRPEIDAARIGLIGHSEGGVIAPMVAATDPRIRAIVLMAGTAYDGRRILEYQNRYALARDTSLKGARLDSALATAMVRVDSIARSNAWIGFFVKHDPTATARQVHAPVLILQGATDRQVTSEQANVLAAAFRAGGDPDVTVHVFPERNHLFLRDPSGDPATYAALPTRTIDREVLGMLADWTAAHLAPAGPTRRGGSE